MIEWYYTRNGERSGPFDDATFKQMAASGAVVASDLVWNASLAGWVPAHAIAELGLSAPASAGGTLNLQYSSPASSAGITCTLGAIQALRQTKPWARFVSVMMFIAAGLMLVGGVLVVAAGGHFRRSQAMLVLAYIVVGALFIPPALYLSRYASAIEELLRTQEPRALERALQAQRSCWRFVGIGLAVVIAIYIPIAAFEALMLAIDQIFGRGGFFMMFVEFAAILFAVR